MRYRASELFQIREELLHALMIVVPRLGRSVLFGDSIELAAAELGCGALLSGVVSMMIDDLGLRQTSDPGGERGTAAEVVCVERSEDLDGGRLLQIGRLLPLAQALAHPSLGGAHRVADHRPVALDELVLRLAITARGPRGSAPRGTAIRWSARSPADRRLYGVRSSFNPGYGKQTTSYVISMLAPSAGTAFPWKATLLEAGS